MDRYTFGDDTSPVQNGRKHRRGKGYLPSRRNNAAAKKSNNAASSNSSFRHGGHHYSHAAKGASTSQVNLQQRQQQSHHYGGDGWDNPSARHNSNSNTDETGSLTYSASSSIQSAESSSNSSSFAEILKHIDSDIDLKDYTDPEIKEFMAKQSRAASAESVGHSQYGKMRGLGMEMDVPPPAVAMWMQRNEGRNRQQQHTAQAQTKKRQQQQQQHNLVTSKSHSPSSDLNYSKDSEDEVFGIEFNEYGENVLETIAGHDRDDGVAQKEPFSLENDHFDGKHQNPFRTPGSSAPTSPGRSSSGHVTPPPNSRNKRTSTPPGSNPISRTSSRHSKSSSDGSLDTPAPSSPPLPPPRNPSVEKGRSKNGPKDGDKVVSESALSEAFYAKSWMCGFADSFNFDEFDGFAKFHK
mmetsp:Transcript_23471/g.40049  ORF Transcript_23471/g.40049 Transcript_23471/m.40049 type:complete len:409 (-) Transcript_23471:17-1243(-)|eukprot:CAMPEP_0183730826 /NCGR_PEP_ID=MMETSP0737-20130205/33728_1 /TAXON_ID=385413 /ORGANISM="Thalassiosira miniscula, Strain CCMP1093" /LENGTH=408 /DNA_ID=CAMNT_0025963407 /DNA_START=629 /DNA_END=1855 /DNA_ORIENTATION=-